MSVDLTLFSSTKNENPKGFMSNPLKERTKGVGGGKIHEFFKDEEMDVK